jgi:hypothetical protein
MKRREFINKTALLCLAGTSSACNLTREKKQARERNRSTRIGVSTYSFWQFNGPKEACPIETCIDQAAEMGFDGVEILHVQMISEDNAYLQGLKRRAFVNGLDLCGFSTHQGFVSPDADIRQQNIESNWHTNWVSQPCVSIPVGGEPAKILMS